MPMKNEKSKEYSSQIILPQFQWEKMAPAKAGYTYSAARVTCDKTVTPKDDVDLSTITDNFACSGVAKVNGAKAFAMPIRASSGKTCTLCDG